MIKTIENWNKKSRVSIKYFRVPDPRSHFGGPRSLVPLEYFDVPGPKSHFGSPGSHLHILGFQVLGSHLLTSWVPCPTFPLCPLIWVHLHAPSPDCISCINIKGDVVPSSTKNEPPPPPPIEK